jgi:hypothetical protein
MNNRLLALFLLLAFKTFAQSGNFFETYDLNLNSNIIVKDAIETKDGGYAMCGYCEGFIGSDFFVIKTDSLGQIQWTFKNNEFDGSDFSNEAHKLIETEDSSIIIAGVNNGITGLDNLFYAKIDANGLLKWKMGNPILQNIGVGSLNYENDSNIILLGNFGTGKYFIKLNSNGDTLQTKKISFHNNLRYSLLKTVKMQNHYYLSGKIDTVLSATAVSYFRITKIDSVGNFLWTKTLLDSANSADYSDIRILDDSLLLHLAYYLGSLSCNKVKFLDKEGNLLSTIKANSFMSGLAAFIDDSSYVYTQLSLGDTLYAHKTDFKTLSLKKYKGSPCKFLAPMIIFKDKKNRIIFSGYMHIPNIPNSNLIGFMMRYDTETNIGISPIQFIKKIKVYPCPGSELTSFSISEDLLQDFKHFTIKIFDEQGKLVLLKDNIDKSLTTLNTSKLNGLYTFEISSNNNSYSGKLILKN